MKTKTSVFRKHNVFAYVCVNADRHITACDYSITHTNGANTYTQFKCSPTLTFSSNKNQSFALCKINLQHYSYKSIFFSLKSNEKNTISSIVFGTLLCCVSNEHNIHFEEIQSSVLYIFHSCAACLFDWRKKKQKKINLRRVIRMVCVQW